MGTNCLVLCYSEEVRQSAPCHPGAVTPGVANRSLSSIQQSLDPSWKIPVREPSWKTPVTEASIAEESAPPDSSESDYSDDFDTSSADGKVMHCVPHR